MTDELKAGDVIQINPDSQEAGFNPNFAGLLMIVEAVKIWGVTCFCQSPENGADTYHYRAPTGAFKRVGPAPWPAGKEAFKQ